jgi:glycosyltransferase involved in cell wall biosynthesis
MKRILILEPYYGGSHKIFLQGLQRTVKADYTLLTLLARKWKMRMQLSAPWFVNQLYLLPEQERRFDTVLCSTFVDVAVLRALLATVCGWNHKALICTYFHENQFVYPNQVLDKSMQQFTCINFTTALATDRCAFNSQFNLDTFLVGIQAYLKKAADMELHDCVDCIREKSIVLYPGMDYSSVARVEKKKREAGPPVIVWNHRWEHDKGPELFFEALYLLQEKGIAFRLVVLGQSFSNVPECFVRARQRLAKEILHFGYVKSKERYGQLLSLGDVVVSTALHEFYGIAVLEAIRAGCYPLLPAALSYPELYDKAFLYGPGALAGRLEEFLVQPVRLGDDVVSALTRRFEWERCGDQYKQWLF